MGIKKAKLTTPKKKDWLEHKASALPDNDNIDSYRKFIKELIERYDGDDNFGTVSKPPEIKIREVIIRNPLSTGRLKMNLEEMQKKAPGFGTGQHGVG